VCGSNTATVFGTQLI